MTARIVGLSLALGAFASLPVVPAAQDARRPPDSIVDLGTLGGPFSIAVAVNDRRQVIGNSETQSGELHSFLWEDGAMRDLMAGPPGTPFGAADLNDRGQLTGAATDVELNVAAAIWDDGRVTVLETPSWATGCSGRAINDHADVAGLCFQGSEIVAVVWTRKGLILTIGAVPGVGPYVPTAINNDGLVVGYISAATGFGGGFAWKDGAVVRLDPFAVAEDVNDRGQIVGWGEPGGVTVPLLFDGRGLAVLPGVFTGAIGQAFAINRDGDIAGQSGGDPVLWTGGPPRVLPVLPGGLFAFPTAINDRGDVAGHATTQGAAITHAVLWPRVAAHGPDKAID